MDHLRFGTGGTPLTSKSSKPADGIARMHELGLQHWEMEFVQAVYIKEEQTAAVKELAEANDVTLSAHGSYYVNLASPDKAKWHASITRVMQAAKITDACGGLSVTYHSGFIQGQPMDLVYKTVLEGTAKILDEVKELGLKVRISPELTGKESQFGDLPDLLKLVAELRKDYGSNIGFCFDFAHKFARSVGKFNTYDEFMQMLDDIRDALGEESLHDMHIHLSAIEFSDKGERNHLTYLPTFDAYKSEGVDLPEMKPFFDKMEAKRLTENRFNWRDLLKAFKKADVGGFVVCESPVLELDALLMQTYYKNL